MSNTLSFFFSVFVADPSCREAKRKVSYPLRKISSSPAQFTEIIKGDPDVENTGNAQGIALQKENLRDQRQWHSIILAPHFLKTREKNY